MENVKKFRAILALIILIIMLIAFIPFFQKIVYYEKPSTPDKIALQEAYKDYEWTMEMTTLYETVVPMDRLENQFAVKKGDKCGVIDVYGNEVVPIINESVKIRTDAADGIYPICIDAHTIGKNSYRSDIYVWGFIDENGEYLVNPQYTEVQMFVGNYTAVKDGDLWSIIDINGNILHTFDPGEYPKVTLDEGFFWVNDKGTFDIHTNNYVYNAPFFEVDKPFPMPYGYDTLPLEATILYENEDGETIVEKVFSRYTLTKNGYAVVERDVTLGKQYGIIKLDPKEDNSTPSTVDPDLSNNASSDKTNEADNSVCMYRCSEMVYKHDAVPTHGSGTVTLDTGIYTLNDYAFVLCEDDCSLESIVSRCSQGYAPAYEIIETGKYIDKYSIHKFAFHIPEPMENDLKECEDYERTLEYTKLFVFYLIEFDDNRYVYLEIEQPEPLDDTLALDLLVKKIDIIFTPA